MPKTKQSWAAGGGGDDMVRVGAVSTHMHPHKGLSHRAEEAKVQLVIGFHFKKHTNKGIYRS